MGSNVGMIFGLIAWAAAAQAPPAAEKTVETGLYTLSLEKVVGCGPASGAAPAAAVSAKTWVGFAIRTRSKAEAFFVTSRDFSLQNGGLILQARHIDPPKLPGCTPLFKQGQLRPKQGVAGFVLFEVPNGFRAAAAAAGAPPLLLTYQPTRWGGAKRVEIIVPACLETCDPEKPQATKRIRSARSVTPAQRR